MMMMESAAGRDHPRPAVFFDRDGTLMEEVHYCRDPREVRVMDGVADGLQQLRDAGWLVILITNQSGIGRGLISLAEYGAVHAEFLNQINGELDAAYFCPDAPPASSPRRKPATGMIDDAMRDFSIDCEQSWMVGDKLADIACGRAAGLRTVLVETGYGSEFDKGAPQPDHRVADAVDAIRLIMASKNRAGVTQTIR